MTNLIALPDGTELVGDYRIQRVLGAGGFGVTYLASELALTRDVTIKEYFPADFAARANGRNDAAPRSADCAGDFKWGLDRFIEEAQTLARFDHPNIVRVYRYFRANNTGYMVLQFEAGQSLKSWLKGLSRAPRQAELDAILTPLLEALELIHKADFLHRDIAPDNIIIRNDGAPVLIDFGSARGDMLAHSKTVSALVKPGYSPYEQYAETSRAQGPWSDIYALAATVYHAITGKRPPDSPSRVLKDEYVRARDAAVGAYRAGFLRAIDKALAINVDHRPQSVAAWRAELFQPDPPKPSWLSRGKAAKREPPADPLALDMQAAGVAITDATGRPIVPPQPDVPGKPGGLLDFFDAFRAKPSSAPPPPLPGPVAAVTEPIVVPPEPAVRKRKAPVKVSTKPRDKARPRVVAKAKTPPKSAPPPAAVPAVTKAATRRPADLAALPAARAAPPVKAKKAPGARGRAFSRAAVKLTVAGFFAAAAVFGLQRFVASEGGAPSAALVAQDAPVMLKEFRAHSGEAAAIAFTEDGRQLVSAGRDGLMKVWSSGQGQLVRTIVLDNRLVTSLNVSGRRAVTGHGEGLVALYDLDRGERLAQLKRNDADVWSVAFLGGPDRVAAAGHDWKTALWDTKAPGQPQVMLEGHENAVQSVAYSVHGPWLATGSADKTVRLYDTDTRELLRTYKGPKDFVTALGFSPDGKSLAIASLDGSIRIYSTQSTRLQRQSSEHKGRVTAVAFSPDGRIMASASDDGAVKVWDAKRGRTIRTLSGHAGGAKSVAFSADGSLLASTGVDGMVRLWSVPTVRSKD